ncbi:hypothetical protein ABEB36_008668 [Hypothenemus hampei]|uniref:Uncharacterized protein n=1 Tax=Hypothenemus hampei TaxID=57062 RepID=A0ABD1EN43_HYPHA
MKICQCERYKEVVNKFKFFSLGTMHLMLPRLSVPENSCITWKCIKANPIDTRPNKPIIIAQDINTKTELEPTLETKWIPVSPGVISQKFVNESKHLDRPF